MDQYPPASAYPPPAGAQTPNNGLAIASLATALVSWILGGLGTCLISLVFPLAGICPWVVFLIGNLVAAILGHMGQSQIKASGGAQGGNGMALTGIILGWIGVGINVLLFCLAILMVVLLALMGPAIGNVFSNILLDI